jgi:hypothetical protein
MNFWVFDRPMMAGSWAYAEPVRARYGEAPRCSACGRFIGMKPWLPPRTAKLVRGTRSAAPADAITGPGFDGFLASTRFVDEFQTANLKGITGWEPVTLQNWNESRYSLGILPSPTVRADLEAMNVVFEGGEPTCPLCARADVESYAGVAIDEQSWRGEDIFRLTNLGILLVSEAFVQLVAACEFTGFTLTKASEYIPSFVRKNIGAG